MTLENDACGLGRPLPKAVFVVTSKPNQNSILIHKTTYYCFFTVSQEENMYDRIMF